jgi:hypothetical protein
MSFRFGPVAAVDASATDRGSRRPGAFSKHEAIKIVSDLARCGGRHELISLVRRFLIGRDGSADRTPTSSFVELLAGALEREQFVLVKGWDVGVNGSVAAGETGTTPAHPAREENLAALIMGAANDFSFEGTRYRLMTATQAGATSGRDAFRVVGANDARATLERMAARLQQGSERRAALEEAVSLIAQGGPPNAASASRSSGLVLLRFNSAPSVSNVPREPAVTPSKAVKDASPAEVLDWIEIEVVDDNSQPYLGNYRIVLPDGRSLTGVLDGIGKSRSDGISPGSCQLSFPDLDASFVQAV